jgi:hypothetical protein
MVRRLAIWMLMVGTLPSAWAFECNPENLAKLAAARRGVASVDVTPEGKEGTTQQLRLLLPELGRVPTESEIFAHADKILAGSKPVLKNNFIPQGNSATWRAGELIDGLQRMGAPLSPEQQALAFAYRRARDSTLVRGTSLSLADFNQAQIDQIRLTLEMMGIHPKIEGDTLQLADSHSTDSLALSRAIYLLRDWKKSKKDFDTSFDTFVGATEDLIVSRAKPQEITAVPQIYRRWESHVTQGHNAIRFVDAKMYKDPSGRMHVIEIPKRTISAGVTIEAKTEAILLVPLSETPSPGANIGMRVSFDEGRGTSTDPRTCLACHRTSGNQLFTIIPNRRLGDPANYAEGQLLAGPNLRAKFISSSALREHLATPANAQPAQK